MTPPASAAAARVIQRGDGILVAEHGTTSIALWRKDSTLERFNVQRLALTDTVRRFPGKAGFFCVVEASSGAPDEAVRKASGKMLELLGTDLRGIAMIIEGNGFRSALVRSVASGIVMLVPRRAVPISYFADIEAGAAWLHQRVDLGSPAVFAQRVNELRASMGP